MKKVIELRSHYFDCINNKYFNYPSFRKKRQKSIVNELHYNLTIVEKCKELKENRDKISLLSKLNYDTILLMLETGIDNTFNLNKSRRFILNDDIFRKYHSDLKCTQHLCIANKDTIQPIFNLDSFIEIYQSKLNILIKYIKKEFKI